MFHTTQCQSIKNNLSILLVNLTVDPFSCDVTGNTSSINYTEAPQSLKREAQISLLLNAHEYIMLLFVCLSCFRPTREFSTHVETSPLPMKRCKF